MKRNLLTNIFSITNYNETHSILRLFGMTLKFPKWKYTKIMSELPYNSYKKKNLDISTLPPAKGQLRDIQLANLALLMEMDFVCKENNLKYWIDFGSLLGAVRHKGFIPWDDDVDLGMPRNDYEKIIDAFNKSSRNPDIFADYFRCSNNACQLIIKVQHKKCPKLFVDIFPYDIYNKNLSIEEQIQHTLDLKDLRKEMEKECTFSDSNEVVKNIIKMYINRFNTDILDEKFDYIWGLDFNHHWKNWFASSDMIFPLKEIVFENGLFPCINDTDGYLKKVYGNYMSYPKKIGYGHNMFAKLTDEEYDIIKELRSLSEKSYNIRDL